MNYTEIIALALSYSDRSDAEVVDRMDNFLRMIEPRINRAFQVSKMSNRATLTTLDGQEYYGLPSDFNSLRDIEISATGSSAKTTLKYLNPEQMNNLTLVSDISGIYYTIIADQLHILPLQSLDKIIEIVYYQNLPPLTADNPNNWVSDTAPDVYINGLLTEISAFVKDAKTASLWNERFKIGLTEIGEEDQITRWSGTPLEIRHG